MKGFSMNKVLGSIRKRPTFGGGSSEEAPVDPANDTPESIATRCVKQFCKSVGSASGDDVIFLPSIVEAAVASPAAGSECARLIRKYMDREYWSKPSYQYNAIMILRILADNPGPSFTRNLDKKFVDTTKELLRSGRDGSVRQILMETLDWFETSKGHDEGLAMMIEMWRKEKEKAYKAYGVIPALPRTFNAPPFNPQPAQTQQSYSRPAASKRLPDPVELANRLEEARTSAKLLEQVVACTPPSEVLSNDLIKEFADRCTAASRSIQGYMSCEDPAPDNDTMESLIDTNEQLQQALNQHHRAVLQAKKQLNHSDTRSSNSSPASRQTQQLPSQSRPLPPRPTRNAIPGRSTSTGNGKGKATLDVYDSSPVAGPSRSASGTPHRDLDPDSDSEGQDPFRDPPPEKQASASSSKPRPLSDGPPFLSFEPFHPGFGGAGSSSSSAAAAGTGAGSRAAESKDAARRASVSDEELEEYRAGLTKQGSGHRY
ncbi:hypothetical protein VTI74DRAFT_1027 [Chaetomium olivicolor]